MVSFQEGIQNICKELEISQEDYNKYTNSVGTIATYLIEDLKEMDPNFARAFRGLHLTASYLDRLKIQVPDEYDIHILLEMPYALAPEVDLHRPGLIFLKAKHNSADYIDLLDNDNYLNRRKLQSWFHSLLVRAMANASTMSLGSEVFSLENRGEMIANTIWAISSNSKITKLSIDFVPAFEFKPRDYPFQKIQSIERWFAVPKGKKPKNVWYDRTFFVSASHSEGDTFKDKCNLKNSLHLMKALREVNDLGYLKSCVIKSVYLIEAEKCDDEFWEKTPGEILLQMLLRLQQAFDRKELPYYIEEDQNLLDYFTDDQIQEYRLKLQSLRSLLYNLQESSHVGYAALRRLF